jgi:UDP-2,4-diacetamido-2,4,6-trideoxy-beta-L-altropyranose hydrolase
MNIFFRVDASSKIGSGHVMRCLNLADQLKKKGANCKFICRNLKDNLIEKIKKNHEITVLSTPKQYNKNLFKHKINSAYFNYLGVNWKDDARQTINALNKKKVDWLIVDHYGIDKRWEKKIKSYVKKIMIIDDLANRYHDCELLLNQNLINNCSLSYQKLLPRNCTCLIGPKYALLNDEYKNKHKYILSRKGPVKRILIYFGSTDQNSLIKKCIKAFLKLNEKNIKLDIVVNLNIQKKLKNQKLIKKNKNIKFYNNLNSIAPLICKADLSIGACGISIWERCCLGLPSIVITIADNQKSIAKELHKRRLIHLIGHFDKVNVNLIFKILKQYINKDLKTWSSTCKLVTDGKGVEKLASVLTLSSKTKLKSRYASLEDEMLLLNWANDPLVRSNGFNSKIINKKNHNKWFNFRILNKKICKILIVMTTEKVPIGQVRFEKTGKKWYINYSLASFARGQNISSNLLKVAISKLKKNKKTELFAKIKKNNLASFKALENVGFTRHKSPKNKFNIFKYKL